MFFFADRALIIKFLVENYPNDNGADPIYIDMNNVRNPNQMPVGKGESQEQPSACSSKSGAMEASSSKASRYDWPVGETKKLLVSIKDNKDKFEDAKNKNSVWSTIAEDLGIAGITGHQCRERYYTLKKAYRKFVTDSNKTGNKRPKPFIYDELMADIVQDDPIFTPVVAKGTLGVASHTDQSESDADVSAVSEESGSVSQPKKKKTQVEELKEYMQQRDERFLEALASMNEKQNKLMEKLIEKL